MTIYKYAGFWRRFIAYSIDGCIVSFIFILLIFISGLAFLPEQFPAATIF